MGYFGRKDMEEIPQVLGEFKDDRSGLDKPQANRPNDRSPVAQCLDYLREARSGLNTPILPTWGIVTDMNEFRLYFFGNKAQYQRFVIQPSNGDLAVSLLEEGDDGAFQRFLFYRVLQSGWLLSTGVKSRLEKLLLEQLTHEQNLEKEFYLEYRAYRESFYQALRLYNPQYEKKGRLRRLVKFTQRILDRCLFILYCEDMGRELNYPPKVLRDVLIYVSKAQYYTRRDRCLGQVETAFRRHARRVAVRGRTHQPIQRRPVRGARRNGCAQASQWRFLREEPVFDAAVAVSHDASLFFREIQFRNVGRRGGAHADPDRAGRIFEQSITDLEVMEARAEGRKSLTELAKRKRDGVYYTPEWVTHYIVEETVGARLAEIREEIGFERFDKIADEQIKAYRANRRSKIIGEYKNALTRYQKELDKLKVVDPACGSGALLIQAFQMQLRIRWCLAQRPKDINPLAHVHIYSFHMAL